MRGLRSRRVGLMIPATGSLVSAPKTDCLKCPDVGTGHKVRVLTYCVAMSSHVLISDCRTAALVAVLSGASLSFTTCPVAAQQPVPQQLVASLRVVDKKGAPFTDLAPNEFDVKENGQSRTIVRAELDTRPLSVALVLDSNGTLSTAFMQNVVPAAVAVLNALPQGTVLDVWSTGDRPTHVVTAQSDRAAVEAAVKRIAASGTNMLLDTIAAASQALPSGEDRRTAVIVLTSGSIGDNAGRGVQEALNATSMRPTFVSIEMILGERDGRVGTELTYLAEHTAGSYRDGALGHRGRHEGARPRRDPEFALPRGMAAAERSARDEVRVQDEPKGREGRLVAAADDGVVAVQRQVAFHPCDDHHRCK